MNEHEFVSPIDDELWRAFHDIRRMVLFEARGRFGVYDEAHLDDRAPGNYPKLLMFRGEPVGVVRIDIDGPTARLRRVAIRSDLQRRGHGRALLSLAEAFARRHGCQTLVSHVAPDAAGFYERCGFAVSDVASESVLMFKPVDVSLGSLP
jgi:GNAT superfamily N-acetyltransferase